ncbi:Rqc2 family fibronectin-binding protein [Mastigocoleus testarum]|uniref:Rqc2 homolog RqcH n=1 Tax=Mastigocoleus testarum BC008 TaxID=371196 RepID=A0A0V7ZVN6_9CYAN|nr:NFACT RNA binding domain-containing protein [Mastigocoleus testarum]KST67968.1 ferrous iron transporter A [Mastigocoleus testarum BC008]KST68407.1 ferrous iron transporter A [Mastigocoleus testarum BC008]
MQTFDYTTLKAVCSDIRDRWLPSRLEQVHQRDKYTIAIALRTLKGRSWLDISRHPQAARICIGEPPPRKPDTFTFSQQLVHQLGGLALIEIETIAPWERAIDLRFARRPDESPLYHLYVEIMGKYSNMVLTDANNQIITVAHQISQQKSSVRSVLTGQLYEAPPALTNSIPSLSEPFERWWERVSLVPGSIKRQLLKTYRGISPSLLESMLQVSEINPQTHTDKLTSQEWQKLFQTWRVWLQSLEQESFNPALTKTGYTVLGWGGVEPVQDIQVLIDKYYTEKLNQQAFSQLQHQLNQKINNFLTKLRVKAQNFEERLQQSDRADEYRQKADLLMAHLHEWKPGIQKMVLPNFENGEPVKIKLEPDKNAVQNAQGLYKKHQKLKRARFAVEPLLLEVKDEINYLEQVEASISQINNYQSTEDLQALEEIREELVGQKYLEDTEYRRRSSTQTASTNFHQYHTPGGFEVLIGRNNRQNDQLSFKIAGDYDLWFHAQEIPGSHVLLRLEAGTTPKSEDLQFVANLAAYHSRSRQSKQVPVVYTQPKYVYKPKGAKPGIAIYKQEQVIWGKPYLVEGD